MLGEGFEVQAGGSQDGMVRIALVCIRCKKWSVRLCDDAFQVVLDLEGINKKADAHEYGCPEVR